MISIDKISYNSKLRYTNATLKFIYAISTLAFCVFSRSIVLAVVVLFINSYLIVKKGGLPIKRYWHYLTVPVTFMLLSVLAIIVNFSSTPMNAFAIPIFDFYITSSYSLLYFAMQVVVTAIASVSSLYFLSLTTPMTDILMVLKKLHINSMIIELMMLIYRYIFVLLEIAYNIITSQNSRLGNKDYKTSLSSFGKLGSVLFVRAIKKSNLLYDAMESRCYDGVINVLTKDYKTTKKEVIFTCITLATYLIMAIFAF